MKISVVVPVYQDAENTSEYLNRSLPVLGETVQDFEVIFAMDPSKDETEEIILKARQKDPRVKLLKFSRRFGQPTATLAGLQYATGDAVIVMDVDLQDPPELIPAMIAKWQEGFDVVYARRRSRQGETLLKSAISAFGYQIINRVSEVWIPPDTGDFRLMSRRVVNEINQLKECHGFLRGLVAFVGFKQTGISFDRPPRFSGRGHYNRLLGSLKIGLNGLFCFSNYTLSLSSKVGFLTLGIAFLLGAGGLGSKFLGCPFFLPHPTLVLLMLTLGGIQLVSLGIVGEYLGRIYEEVRQRPKFIVESAVGFDTEPARRNA